MEQQEIFERIDLYPKGSIYDHLSIYLKAVETANMSEGWKRDVKFKLSVFNQVDANLTIIKEFGHKFIEKRQVQGESHFIKLTELCDPNKGFLVNDACIVGVDVFVLKAIHEKQVYQTVKLTSSLTFGSQNGNVEVDNLGLNAGSRCQNLETSSNVSIEPTKDCGVESAFSGLGRVLYFLQTRKVRDMNEHGCKELQVLWDGLEKFKFYLTWLMPHVQYALGMQSFVKKSMEVEKLKDSLVVLELETMRLKEKLVSAEINLDVERELLKAKGVVEIGLTSDLGCGTWKA